MRPHLAAVSLTPRRISPAPRRHPHTKVLELIEANDNHAEEHTVAEFVEFCIDGCNAKSGVWTSKGVGKYLEGGKAAGGILVDQRFCPRIVEGELRYNCVGPKLVSVWRAASASVASPLILARPRPDLARSRPERARSRPICTDLARPRLDPALTSP